MVLTTHHLSEREKLEGYLTMIVPNARMQVEPRGPYTFGEAATYAERAGTVLSRIFGEDTSGKLHR